MMVSLKNLTLFGSDELKEENMQNGSSQHVYTGGIVENVFQSIEEKWAVHVISDSMQVISGGAH